MKFTEEQILELEDRIINPLTVINYHAKDEATKEAVERIREYISKLRGESGAD